jgi:hypothetical protein
MIWKKIVPNPNTLLSGDEMDVLMTSREKKNPDFSDDELAYPVN